MFQAELQLDHLIKRMIAMNWRQCILVFPTFLLSLGTSLISLCILVLFSVHLYPKYTEENDLNFSFFVLLGSADYMRALPNNIQRLALLAGMAHRIGELLEGLEGMQIDSSAQSPQSTLSKELATATSPTKYLQDSIHFEARGLSACFPCTAEPVIRELAFDLKQGLNMAIRGPTGCGKTSLLRVLAGLWPAEDGTLFRPAHVGRGGVLFVPHRKYNPPGSLRQQILYPLTAEEQEIPDSMLEAILNTVGLGYLSLRWGLDHTPDLDWSDVLSSGEQQKLAFARVLYHRPAFAILDESSSALDEKAQEKCLRACRASKIVMIHVTHRSSVITGHELVLTYLGPGHFQAQSNNGSIAELDWAKS
jgi:ATP-binding cassette subfamily D (ALD) long-chain fatty acid import protein